MYQVYLKYSTLKILKDLKKKFQMKMVRQVDRVYVKSHFLS